MASTTDSSSEKREQPQSQTSSIFTIPRPIKVVFDTFPLRTYSANTLPARAPSRRDRSRHRLHIFTTVEGAQNDAPSFNPACLMWQTYLKFLSISFETIPSTNHASPSGSLPFLLPAESETDPTPITPVKPTLPITSGKLRKWALKERGIDGEETKREDGDENMRFEAYMSLVERGIRRAWLYALYLTPLFPSQIVPFYITSSTTNPLINHTNSHNLRAAAASELLRSDINSPSIAAGSVINEDVIYSEAEDALRALDTLLGDDEWFFGAKEPGMLDAGVWSYIWWLGGDGSNGDRDVEEKEERREQWRGNKLCEMVREKPRLIRHRERVWDRYWASRR